jgi:hypothetical protein
MTPLAEGTLKMLYSPLQRGKQPPSPSDVYKYFDRTHVWLKEQGLLTPHQLHEMAAHCGGGVVDLSAAKLYRDGRVYDLPIRKRPCKFHPDYRQGLQLLQPTRRALVRLAAMTSTDEVMLTHVEIAQDYVFDPKPGVDTQAVANAWLQFFLDHLVQPWHRKSMRVHCFYKYDEVEIDGKKIELYHDWPMGWTTRTTPKGKRKKGSWFTGYADQPCRLTGETPCFHIERRYCGSEALRRIDIHTLHDLIDFNFDQFFADHMKLSDVDYERLGRADRNKQSGARRKHSRIDRYGFNQDERLGRTIYYQFSRHTDDPLHSEHSIQNFVDNYPNARRFLVPVRPYVHRQESSSSSDIIAAQRHFESPVGREITTRIRVKLHQRKHPNNWSRKQRLHHDSSVGV